VVQQNEPERKTKMNRIFVTFSLIIVFGCFLGNACRPVFEPPEREKVSLIQVSKKKLPVFKDDIEGNELKEAIRLQIEKMKKGDLNKSIKFGEMVITRKRILKTLECFYALLEKNDSARLNKEIAEKFTVFKSTGFNQKGDVLFTAYYQPVLDASLRAEGDYQYPLYRPPYDLQVIDLGQLNPKYAGEKVALRVNVNKIMPYFDRQAIDKEQALKGKGLELVYLKDYLDRYMLQVQGSGVMRMESGEEIKVQYAGSNCYPYTSLREILVDKKKVPPDKATAKDIRAYFDKNPEEVKKLLYQNRRYIFFEKYSGNVRGSEGVDLTAGRSIATDKKIFPGGGLAFIHCRKPVLNSQGEIIRWEPMIRFMVDQDAGAAIKGPGRVDIFWGTGKNAGDIAGRMKEKGNLFFLLIKEDK
jgi:membrane-bound lytic murein transglycosylase A